MIVIETERLILRTWKEKDIPIFFEMHQEQKVTEFTDKPFTLQQLTNFVREANDRQNQYNYTAWAVEVKKTGELIGFASLYKVESLKQLDWKVNQAPEIGMGWCMGSHYWGQGFATEAAKAMIDYGFYQCNMREISAFTVPMNKGSIRVMEKVGMQRDFECDFNHPDYPVDHKNSFHVLYRIRKPL